MPHTFKTTDGQAHTLALTVGLLRRIRDHAELAQRAGCPVDLFRIGADQTNILAKLYEDPLLACDVLAVALELDPAELSAKLDGPAAQAALAAFWDELADFFHGYGSEAQRQAITNMARIMARANTLAAAQMEQTTAAALAELETTLTSSPTNSAASPALTPSP